MSDSQKYNLVYAGAVAEGFSEDAVKNAFVYQLKIPEDKVDRLFSGKRVILKKSLSKLNSERWQVKLNKIGAEIAIVPFIDPDALLSKPSNSQSFNKNSSAQRVNQRSSEVHPRKIDNISDYDDAMKQKILNAKAMIEAQKLEQQISSGPEKQPIKKLLVFSGFLGVVILMLYFYLESMV